MNIQRLILALVLICNCASRLGSTDLNYINYYTDRHGCNNARHSSYASYVMWRLQSEQRGVSVVTAAEWCGERLSGRLGRCAGSGARCCGVAERAARGRGTAGSGARGRATGDTSTLGESARAFDTCSAPGEPARHTLAREKY